MRAYQLRLSPETQWKIVTLDDAVQSWKIAS
jgi:hypothetical protein